MKKFIVSFLLMLVAFMGIAQNTPYGEFYYIRLYPGGTTSTAPGTMRYRFDLNKFEFREGSAWVQIGGGGSGGITDGDKGDISVSGTGATWLIDNGAIGFAKMQSIATNTILGRVSAGTGLTEALTPTQVNTMLPIFNTTTKGLVPLSGGGTTNFLRADGTWADPGASGGGSTETASNLLTKVGSDIRMGGSHTVTTTLTLGSTGTVFSIEDPQLEKYGIIRGTGFGFSQGIHYVAGDYLNKALAYSRFTPWNHSLEMYHENSAGENVTFRVGAAGSGSLYTTYTDNKTIKTGIMYSGTGYETQPQSLVTRAWVEQAISASSSTGVTDGDKGDLTVSSSGAVWDIDDDAVSFDEIQNITGLRFLGRSSSTTGNTEEITGATATAMLSTFNTTAKGLVPASPGGSSAFLRADGTWATPPSGSTPGVFTSTVNGLVPASGGGTAKYLRSDATWQTFPTMPTDGTYTPTLVNAANITSSTAYIHHWTRIGSKVTVSGRVDVTTTSSGVGTLSISLPPPNLGSGIFMSSTAANGSGAVLDLNMSVALYAAVGTDDVTMRIPTPAGAKQIHYSFTYQIP